MNEEKKEKVVSSKVERLVYTEAVESSNPSLPKEGKERRLEQERKGSQGSKRKPCLGSSGGRVPG